MAKDKSKTTARARTSLRTSSIAELHRALRAGKVSAEGLAEEAIANHGRFDDALGAYKLWDPDAFLAQARAADAAFAAGLDLGLMQGLPVSVKDIYGLSGYPIFAGSPRELPERWRHEGPVVGAMRSSLATVPGKTHTVEFAFGGIGSNPHWGTPRNPWHKTQHRAPGGSSAGAGVSLQTGTAVVAIGSDTAGSVRCPASATGTVGIKTSYGRWSTEGIVPLSPSLDTAGILARSAEDAALAFALIDPLTDTEPFDFLDLTREIDAVDFRIGIVDWFFEDCRDDIAASVKAAIDELARSGMEAVALHLPEAAYAHAHFLKGGLTAPEFAAFINGEMAGWKATLDPNVLARFTRMEAITAVDYLHRKRDLAAMAAEAHERLGEVDLVLAPTIAISPPDLAALADPAAYLAANLAILRNTAPINFLGLCAVTIPVGLDGDGMPVGMQVIAPAGEDERALAAACAFERVLGSPRARLGIAPLCRR